MFCYYNFIIFIVLLQNNLLHTCCKWCPASNKHPVSSGVTINRILDLSRLWLFGSIHDSLLPRFDFGSICAHIFQGALSELLYCKIGIQNALNCAFMIDEQRQ